MMGRAIHKNGHDCQACDKKRSEMHMVLQDWFDEVRKEFPDVHCSCAYRNEEEQKLVFNSGKSKVTWPNSKHNAVNKIGRPCSRAFDLFMLDSDGKAVFDKKRYGVIAARLMEWGAPIVWGGDWKSWKDYPHFELKGTSV